MLLDFDAFREIYLVFMNTNYLGSNWFKDGFRHVYAIERSALGWQCTDPSTSDIHTHILPADYTADVMGEFRRRHPNFHIIKLHVKPHDLKVYPRPGIISCVSVMQYMLGVYWPFVFTPFQLYTKIKNKPSKHIEVIEWLDTKFTKPNEMHNTQPKQPIQHDKT